MLFDSVVFLFSFLPVVLLLYHAVPGKLKNAVLLLASLVFYAWGEPTAVLWMAGLILFHYLCGLALAKRRKKRRGARLLLSACVAVNLGVMVFFLYGRTVTGGQDVALPSAFSYHGAALPMGMSFYILQMLSYVIDVYRGEAKAQKNLLELALYVAMFPKLPAGPVVRYADMEKQLHARQESWGKLGEGAMLFIWGLSKKVLIADHIGTVYTEVMALDVGQRSVLSAWLGCAAFAFWLYYSLSGYSDMAVGLGRMVGFDLPGNFDHPYMAESTTEFWFRWHMSLGAWFREYIYHPLGGGDAEETKQIRNILGIWLTVGLYHGLSWNYFIWGLYCGMLMVVEKSFLWRFLDGLPGLFARLYSVVMVLAGWVFFFRPGPGEAFTYLGTMFGIGANGVADDRGMYLLVTNAAVFLITVAGMVPFVHKGYENLMDRGGKGRAALSCVLYGVLFLVCVGYCTRVTNG